MSYNDAIASIESSGRYDKLGPFTKSGDRAYGRYQVMGANLPEWTKTALGRPLTPQEFLASPQAQDAVFNHRFGSYVQKYGPEGAARAWFAGEGGMNDPNRRDVLGTSVADYANKFNAAMGQQPPRPPAPIPMPQQAAPNLPLFPPNAMASAQPQQAPQPQSQSTGQALAPSIWSLLGLPQAQAPVLPLYDFQKSYGG